MKKALYKLFIVSFCLFNAAGCDFLDEKSQDEKIPKTANDFSEILMGRGYPWGNDNLLPYVYLMGDDIESYHETAIGIGDNANYQTYMTAYTWQPNMYETSPISSFLSGGSSYYTYYLRIGGCNAVLDMIDDATGSLEKREKTKAEALAIRAMHYFYLVNLYGKPYNVDKKSPGVPLKLTIGVDIEPMARNTVEQVYAQILKDLNMAVAIFEKYDVTRGDFHINLPATLILLSRVYLYMEDWDNCIDAATRAINLGRGLEDMRAYAVWTPINTYSFSETEWLYGKADYVTVVGGANSTSLNFVVAPSLLSLYDQVNDSRYKAFFRTASMTVNTIKYSGTMACKYPTSGTNLGNSIRTSEAYINRAEAYARNNDPKAAADINAIRSHRIVGYTPVGSVTLVEVLIERQKELCYEVPRWFDLRRLGMPSITHKWGNSTMSETYVLKENDPMYTLPIPPEAIVNNSKLIQNDSRLSDPRQPVF